MHAYACACVCVCLAKMICRAFCSLSSPCNNYIPWVPSQAEKGNGLTIKERLAAYLAPELGSTLGLPGDTEAAICLPVRKVQAQL